ncbi:LytTR family DNA-binding domain-containing protein [Sphingobacterium sp.]|uniref:LytR/AlgR family response regulator transcription factor n=1 Tax=Sphingobacterium sp. TaxID=341027 RepID=UPI0031D92AC1
MINCYIVDDLPSQFKVLKILIESTEGLQLMGTETSSLRFLKDYREAKLDIDLLFLDIEMPGISGVELAGMLESKTKVIFTTGHRDFALEAFDLGAVDYLLKPIKPARFLAAIDKVRNLIQKDNLPGNIAPIRQEIYIKGSGKSSWNRINLSDIEYLEADSNYTQIYLSTGKIMVYGTLNQLSAQLPADRFLRIHKSYIINLAHLESGTALSVKMTNGAQIPVGRVYKNELVSHLKP